MKFYLKVSTLLMLLFVTQQNVQAQANHSIKQFEFMLGTWEMKTSKGSITEIWKLSKEGMVGKSYRLHEADGDTVLTEKIILKLVDEVFNFSVTGFEKNNTGTTNFKLISSHNGTFIFENKNHDFPQRIIYQRKDNDNLLAWIEGVNNGKKMKIEFPYHRIK